MPLTLLTPGKTMVVKKISGKEEVRRHLESLGFVAGSNVSVVSEMGGNMIINVLGARVAIGRELASRIMV